MYVNETLKFIVNKNRGCDTFFVSQPQFYFQNVLTHILLHLYDKV